LCLGLIAVGLCGAAQAQPAAPSAPPAKRTIRPCGPALKVVLSMVYPSLLRLPNVPEELKLSDDQQAKIKEAIEKAQAAMNELFAGLRDLPPDQQQAKMEVGSKILEAHIEETKTLESILQPNQLERLKGLSLQKFGMRAISDEEIQRDLKLSADQVVKVKAADEEMTKESEKLRIEGGDPKTVFPAIQQLRAEHEKQVTAVLTADQKASLEKMKGAKFDFSTAFDNRIAPPPAGGQGQP